MKVLYVGQLWEGGTCRERAKVLAERGWQLIAFDITPYLRASSRILASVQHRALWGPDVARFNRDVLQAARAAGRLDIIWIDKGRWLRAATLEELKRGSRALAIHYTPDPGFTVHQSRHFDACLPLYDLCITTKRYELQAYRRKGAREVMFTWQGIDDRFERLAACAHLDGRPLDVVFVGHVEPHYVETLEKVRAITKNMRVHGPGWEHLARWRDSWRGIAAEPVWADALPEALARGRIGLGLLSKRCPDAFTTRSFEVPAAGAMLLAERTADHLELFEEDREAVFFDSSEELSEKLRFYLQREGIRRRIAEAGRARVLANFHWRHVLAPAAARVEEMRRGS
jgi:glycosyltransferase involved in cell wall biosynthesis